MIRLPPRSSCSDTRFPSTALFRSPPRFRPAQPLGPIPGRRASSDDPRARRPAGVGRLCLGPGKGQGTENSVERRTGGRGRLGAGVGRTEEHTSELQLLMRYSYTDFCLKKKIVRALPKKYAYHQDYQIMKTQID